MLAEEASRGILRVEEPEGLKRLVSSPLSSFLSPAPLQTLYLVLVTNKQSNILEDLETMKLLSRILSDYEMDEESISDNCFEIVFAFDEAISFGHREHIDTESRRT